MKYFNLFKAILILFFGGFLTSCNAIKSYINKQQDPNAPVIAYKSEIDLVASEKGYRFIPDHIIVRPGQTLKLKIVNHLNDSPLLFSILKKDQNPIVNAFLGIQAGEENNWAPPHEHILAKTNLLKTNQSESIKLIMPKEVGVYSFISSIPGHEDKLKGVITVESEEGKL